MNKKRPAFRGQKSRWLKRGVLDALSPLRGALPKGEPICASHSGRGGSAADGEGYSIFAMININLIHRKRSPLSRLRWMRLNLMVVIYTHYLSFLHIFKVDPSITPGSTRFLLSF